MVAFIGIGVGGFIFIIIPFTIVCSVKKKRRAGIATFYRVDKTTG